MISFVVEKVGKESIMVTRHEPFDPPVQGLPPTLSSTITLKRSELSHLINILSDYDETEQR